MKWTKRHSQNAVAAKARLRIARANSEPDEIPTGFYTPRRPAADFIISIKSNRGERLQVSAWRLNGRVILSEGIKSVRQLCRGIELLITKSA
jgi:hypothetical protein